MLLTSLIPRVLVQGNSIPSNAAIIQLQETARRFFRGTKVWTTTLTMDSVADQAAYELDLSGEVSEGTTPKVLQILSVVFNGATIWNQAYYLRTSDDYLVFNSGSIPGDAITDGIVVKVAMVPAIDGTDFPQDHVETYVDGLVGGALYRLMMTPGRPYSDPGAADHFNTDYKRDLGRARMDVGSEGTTRGNGYRQSVDNTGGFYG